MAKKKTKTQPGSSPQYVVMTTVTVHLIPDGESEEMVASELQDAINGLDSIAYTHTMTSAPLSDAIRAEMQSNGGPQ